jgi:hypothetical protein
VLLLAMVLNAAIIAPGLLLLQPFQLWRVMRAQRRAVTPRQRFRGVASTSLRLIIAVLTWLHSSIPTNVSPNVRNSMLRPRRLLRSNSIPSLPSHRSRRPPPRLSNSHRPPLPRRIRLRTNVHRSNRRSPPNMAYPPLRKHVIPPTALTRSHPAQQTIMGFRRCLTRRSGAYSGRDGSVCEEETPSTKSHRSQ